MLYKILIYLLFIQCTMYAPVHNIIGHRYQNLHKTLQTTLDQKVINVDGIAWLLDNPVIQHNPHILLAMLYTCSLDTNDDKKICMNVSCSQCIMICLKKI